MSKNGIKIVTIGGGSSYTPELVEGFILRHGHLPVRELWLVDIEAGREKLEIVWNLARRMVEKAGLDMEIHLSYDRREALPGADFVTTQMRIGLLDARIKDERIPLSFGMLGQETNGAGGMFKALRTIPVILDIVKDIQELCPDAWLLNFTNPAAMVTEAISRYTDYKRAIGLCNLPVGLIAAFANLLKVDPKRVSMEIQGSNHFVYATDVFVDGESVFEKMLNEYIANEANETMTNIHGIEFSSDFIRGLGAIPCSYHNYYYHYNEQLADQLEAFKTGTVRAQFVKNVEDELFELYKDENLAVKPKQLELRGGALYSDAACNLIDSIYNNKGDLQYVDVPNNGTVSSLPNDAVIETACIITKNGPKPIALGEFRPEINGQIQMIKTFERLVVEAAVTGSRAKAITALNLNPLIPSDDLANKVFDALLEAHQEYLPQFS